MKQIILLIEFLLLGVVIALLNKYTRRKKQEKSDFGSGTESTDSPNHRITESPSSDEASDEDYERPEGCCGAHEVCENESLLASNTKIIYFADEELDAFKDRDAESYSSEEIEQFEEVFFTLRENELVDWLKSLQLRHVPLPPSIKEQALMIIAERRKEPAID
jgi:hypothetical protein